MGLIVFLVKNSNATYIFQDIIKASKHLNALKIRGNSYVRKFMWIWVTQELKLWGLDGTHCCPQQPSVVLKSKNTTELKSLSEFLYPACVWFNHRKDIRYNIYMFLVTFYVSFFAFCWKFWPQNLRLHCTAFPTPRFNWQGYWNCFIKIKLWGCFLNFWMYKNILCEWSRFSRTTICAVSFCAVFVVTM